uniref:Uncharacterized protein n=1 Tax=Arundo donax TaxID=35708 RepID=A0A0A9H9P8_ARUDO
MAAFLLGEEEGAVRCCGADSFDRYVHEMRAFGSCHVDL